MGDAMGNLAMWNLIIGFLSATFVLPVVQQPTWSSAKRAGVTFGYSVIVGIGTAYFTGAFAHLTDVSAAVTSILLTLVAAISSYKGFAQPTGFAQVIEEATSPTPSTEEG